MGSTYKENLADIDWSIKAPEIVKVVSTRESKRADFPTPRISGDYEGYECPVNGSWIEGKAAHEENLKKTGCRLLERGEKEDNEKTAQKRESKRLNDMDSAIDGIVDSVASDCF